MGLKELKSNLDLLGGFGQGGETLGEMENFSPTKFQLGTDATSQKHIDSLAVVPGGSQNSPYQDLDGEPGPQFQRELDDADLAHNATALWPDAYVGVIETGTGAGDDQSVPIYGGTTNGVGTIYIDTDDSEIWIYA